MFAVVYLPQFALQAALRHEPELWAKPVVLVDPARSTPVVCALTDPARQSGISEGFSPTTALARCREMVVRHRSAKQESLTTDVLLQCAFGFSPNIEATADGLCTLALQGLALLTGAKADQLVAWGETLRATLAALGLHSQVGIGA